MRPPDVSSYDRESRPQVVFTVSSVTEVFETAPEVHELRSGGDMDVNVLVNCRRSSHVRQALDLCEIDATEVGSWVHREEHPSTGETHLRSAVQRYIGNGQIDLVFVVNGTTMGLVSSLVADEHSVPIAVLGAGQRQDDTISADIDEPERLVDKLYTRLREAVCLYMHPGRFRSICVPKDPVWPGADFRWSAEDAENLQEDEVPLSQDPWSFPLDRVAGSDPARRLVDYLATYRFAFEPPHCRVLANEDLDRGNVLLGGRPLCETISDLSSKGTLSLPEDLMSKGSICRIVALRHATPFDRTFKAMIRSMDRVLSNQPAAEFLCL